jgi:serine/threonine protein kinase/tetratricopeptide (TPR) repeat protein
MISVQAKQTCYSRDELRAYTRCELPDAVADRLENHLTTCDTCRKALVESFGEETSHDGLGWDFEQKTPLVPSKDRLGKYRIGREIGRGGMGVLYDAVDEETQGRVAIKFINAATAGRGACKRAIQEFRSLSRLSHPNIVPVLDVMSHDDRPFLVMGYVDGLPLDVWQNLRPIDAVLAARIIFSLAGAIDHAHHQNVIHRDLKPSNIMVSGFGQDNTLAHDAQLDVKVTDFGLAKIVNADSEITQTGEVVGTPSYMSPEQTLGIPEKVGPAADIYGLGAILYELLTGRPPLVAVDPIRTLELVRNTDPIPPLRLRPDLPKSLNTICLKCLEKLPADRYPSAAALADDLAAFIEGRPIKAQPPGVIKQGVRWANRNRGLAAGLGFTAASLLTLVVASLWFAKSQRELRIIADQEKRRAQQAEAIATEQKQLAIANKEKGREFWGRSLDRMQNFSHALWTEIVLGIRSPDEINGNAKALMLSLYGDYLQQLGPVEQWTIADAKAVAMHAMMTENAGSAELEQKLGNALLALDRIEANSEDKLAPLQVHASVLEQLARLSKSRGDYQEAEGFVRQAIDITTRIIGITPDDRNVYRNAAVFSMNLAEILLSLGDQKGFLAMGAQAVRFHQEGTSRLQDDDLSRFWLAERLGHYAHMCLRMGKTEDAIKLIAEARDLIARRPLPELLHQQCGMLLQSLDQMEHDIREASKAQSPQN